TGFMPWPWMVASAAGIRCRTPMVRSSVSSGVRPQGCCATCTGSCRPDAPDRYHRPMSFFAVLMALLLEQVRPVGYDNPVHALLRSWARSAGRHLDTGEVAPAWVAWILAVVLPALVAAIVHAWLAHLSVLLALAWLVLVLYLTLGFRQFSHHFTAIRHAMETGDEVAARQHLAQWLRADVATLPRTELLRHVIEHSVLSAHRHVFGVLLAFFVCWFLGLGPAGAVAYRMADYVLGRWKR